MVNDELFVKTLAQIEAHPEEWRQDTWRCGTAMCFAGWATQLALGNVEWIPNTSGWLRLYGRETHCANVAAVELGLVDASAVDDVVTLERASMNLFAATNTLDGLYRESSRLTGIDEQVLRDKVQAEVVGR